MAAVSASVVGICVGSSVSLQSSGAKVATVNSLRSSPVLRFKATVHRRTASRRSSIRAVAEEKTLTTVRTIIAKQLDVDHTTVLPHSKFADLGADSLDTVEIMMAMEEEFKVSLEDDRAEKIGTVQEAADLIEAVIKAQ